MAQSAGATKGWTLRAGMQTDENKQDQARFTLSATLKRGRIFDDFRMWGFRNAGFSKFRIQACTRRARFECIRRSRIPSNVRFARKGCLILLFF